MTPVGYRLNAAAVNTEEIRIRQMLSREEGKKNSAQREQLSVAEWSMLLRVLPSYIFAIHTINILKVILGSLLLFIRQMQALVLFVLEEIRHFLIALPT